MDILRRNMAPISEKGWEEINETTKEILNSQLSARRFVDFDGPHGLDFGAISTGRITIPKTPKNVKFGINEVMPLVEVRIPFKMNIWELDNAERGAEDIDTAELEKAATELAEFEDNAIYYGLKQANIEGMVSKSEHKPLNYPRKDLSKLPGTIIEAINTFEEDGIEGPYALVVNKDKLSDIYAHSNGYPLKKQIEESLSGGKIISSRYLKEAMLVSTRGEDFRLTTGMDISIGYHSHDSTKVDLYLTESFTFRVIDPAAVIVLK